ncbi:hypothetical protein IMCC3317_34370 [Kordia antarctica]|uniref:Uncharacterized protein n=1 Tax=Kordia antarctica TaxID=1218801 RepID=A0A7L4ZMV3_9FLAO|nr:hypothetical protein [Kordia antarctica]QHI38053.1 hypothetical protein IMCC3317_34370 [Kordia antarctica]
MSSAESKFMELEKFNQRGPSLGFIIGCLMGYNFHSFKRFLIYIFHYCNFLDLKKKEANQYTDEEIIDILTLIHSEKIDKKVLYSLTKLSKNTFNKHYKELFQENGFKGKRKFTLYEIYTILNEWQGEGTWSTLKSIKKQQIADVINLGNLKSLAEEFTLIDCNYKNKDKLSPKEVKQYLKHIDFDQSEKEENLLQYKDFHKRTLWVFGLTIIFKVLEKSGKL